MSLPRFYVDPASVTGGQARLAAAERDHLVRVLRLGPGDEVVLFDGAGREYPGRVLETGRHEAVVAVGEPRPAAADAARARVVLLQGLPRLARMDWLVEKATEAGVSTLVPVLARRSPPEARRAAGRLERWRTIAREACRQCGRSALPEVEPPVESRQAWGKWSRESRRAVLVPGARRGLRRWLEQAPGGEWVLAAGPEGGWEPLEIDQAREAGFEPVSLGPRTLRSETAGLVAVAAVQLLCGDLGGGTEPDSR